MGVESGLEDTPSSVVFPAGIRQGLSVTVSMATLPKLSIHTSTILDFKNGFLMYHVEVRNVSAHIISSILPVSSRLSGEALGDARIEFHGNHIDDLIGRTEWQIDGTQQYPRQCTPVEMQS